VSCPNCTCRKCSLVHAKQKATAARVALNEAKREAQSAEKIRRLAAVWMLSQVMSTRDIAEAFGCGRAKVHEMRKEYEQRIWERTAIHRFRVPVDSNEARLMAAGALPTMPRYRHMVPDVEIPPDDWLVRHKSRDPRRTP
jgi:hypothetical protein